MASSQGRSSPASLRKLHVPALKICARASCRPSKHVWLIGSTIGSREASPKGCHQMLAMPPQKCSAGAGSMSALGNAAAGHVFGTHTPSAAGVLRNQLGALLGPAHRRWDVVPLLPIDRHPRTLMLPSPGPAFLNCVLPTGTRLTARGQTDRRVGALRACTLMPWLWR